MSEDMSAKQLRVGVIGLGIAGASMVPALCQHSRAVLGAAADVNEELRQRFQADHDLPIEKSAQALLERSDIDAVYIATPHQFHREQAIEAARRGKHIIVEKPMALSLDDCEAMREEAKKNNVVLIVGHTHGFDLPVRTLREITVSGEYGPLSMISIWNYTNFLYRPRRQEELDTSKGGGTLFNQLPHHVEMARMIADSPVRSVRASTAILDVRRATEGSYCVFMDFENGAVASMVYSGYDRFDSDELHHWIGSTGRPKKPRHGEARKEWEKLLAPDEELMLRQRNYGYGGNFVTGSPQYQPHFGPMVVSYQKADVRISPTGLAVYADEGVIQLPLPVGSDGRSDVLDELCEAVLEGVTPLHDGHFAQATLKVCLAIQESANKRQEILLSQFEKRRVT